MSSFWRRSPETDPAVTTSPALVPVCVGRQAIFTAADLEVHAHELLFRASTDVGGANLLTVEEHDAATSHVLTATFADFDPQAVSGGLRLFVNLTRAFVVGDLPLLAGPETLVLEITEDIALDDEVLAGVVRLREEGYALALDDFTGEVWRLPLLPLVDYVKLVLDPADRDALAPLVELVREQAPGARIVVECVEDDADVAHCRALKVDLLQGHGLERPVTLTATTLQSSQVVALRLIAALTNPETHLREVEALVETDPGLSLRVLRAASSSMVAASSPVSTVRQAMVLLGPRPLTAWAVLTALSPGSGSGQQRVAMTHVLHRAGACSRLVPADPHTAYTAGLLSATAEVIGVPVEELLATMRVSDDVSRALLTHEGQVGQALAALLAYEGLLPAEHLAGSEGETGLAYLAAFTDAVESANTLSATT